MVHLKIRNYMVWSEISTKANERKIQVQDKMPPKPQKKVMVYIPTPLLTSKTYTIIPPNCQC